MTIDIQSSIDETDRQIIHYLMTDGRMPLTELAQLIGMSAPSVAERIRRLESRHIIKKFTLELDQTALGFTIEAIIRIKPRPGNLHIVEQMIIKEERFTACDKVTGDDCFVARLVLKSVVELDKILDPFHDKAETNSAIIKSSPIKNRLTV
jgi:Lrp/AsnC family transcriptional regulator, leucine-responsive regulatory protein